MSSIAAVRARASPLRSSPGWTQLNLSMVVAMYGSPPRGAVRVCPTTGPPVRPGRHRTADARNTSGPELLCTQGSTRHVRREDPDARHHRRNPLVLPRLPAAAPDAVARPVDQVVSAHHAVEGAGFEVWRPFPGPVDPHIADPFFLLDQLGPVDYAPNEPVGAPWHPHRGFETVTYVMDGVIAHHDSNGGGGIIGEGDTQWMTAGAGILHDEVPTEAFVRSGGRTHGVQLWVNLPAALKFSPPRYQAIDRRDLTLLTSPRRRRAGSPHRRRPRRPCRPGRHPHARSPTPTPRCARSAGSTVPWNPAFSAMAYVLGGRGHVGRGAPTGRRPPARRVRPAATPSASGRRHPDRRIARPRGPAARRPADPRADRPLRTRS